jgi:NAD(P)H-flavin reductase
MVEETMNQKVKIKNIIPQGKNQAIIELDVDQKLNQTYQIPGQYAVIELDDHKPGYFAFCKPPHEISWSFLIKASSPLTNQLLKLQAGDEIKISTAQGNGYDIEKAKSSEVYLFAVGSGIGPIYALLETLITQNISKEIHLYYGCRDLDDFAFDEEIKELAKNQKIKLKLFLSNKDQKTLPDYSFGYVHDDLKDINPKNATAFICGMNEMMTETKTKLIKLGFREEYLLGNY